MVVTSLFPKRTRSRPMLAPQSVQQVWREVRSEDELRQALTPVDVTTLAQLFANTGRRIIIAAPITIKSPITIAATLPGVTIESHGHIPITCGDDGIDAFVVNAPLFTARGLFLTSQTGALWGRAFVLNDGAEQARMIDCHVLGADALCEGAEDVNDVHIRGCDASTPSGRAGDCVTYNGTKWRITDNLLSGSDTGKAVVAGTSGARAAIVGNQCDSTGIDTSAGLGLNVVSSNTEAGTLTTLGTDAVGLNT